jgi:hypothetical protein
LSVKLQDKNNGPISTFQAMSMSSDTIPLENSSAAASSKAFLASKSASTSSNNNNINRSSSSSSSNSNNKVDNSEKKGVKIDASEESRENNSIIVVNRGANEGDPPVWTIVSNCTPMKSAVNVITGTRITHGHPLILGTPIETVDSSWFPENNNLHDHDQATDHRIHTVVDKTSINKKIMNKSAAELVQHQHPVSKSRNLSRQNYSLESALNNTSSSSTVLPSISANIVMSSSNVTSSTTTTITTTSISNTSNSTTRNSVGRLQKAMTLPVQEDSQSSQLLGNTNTCNYAPLNTPVCSKPFVSASETRETLLDVPLLITTSEEDDKKEKKTRNMPAFAIPTFTVTINPLESNEMTYVPGSPP